MLHYIEKFCKQNQMKKRVQKNILENSIGDN